MIYGVDGAVARVFARVFIAGRTQARLDIVVADIAAAGGTVETARVDAVDQRAVEKHAAEVPAMAGCIATSPSTP